MLQLHFTSASLRRVLLKLVIVGVCLTVAGCGSSDSGATEPEANGQPLVIQGEEIADESLWQQAQQEGSLTLYSGMSENRESALLAAFTDQVGLEVELVSIGGSELTERVLSEKGASALNADVIRQAGGALIQTLEGKDVFAKHCNRFWESLPDELKSEDCLWWASLQSVVALVHNTEVGDEGVTVSTWQDLLDPRWKDKVAVQYIAAGGSKYAIAAFEHMKFGVDYWKKLADQHPAIYTSIGDTVTNVARGEVSIAPATASIAGTAKSDGAPIEIVLPADGVPAYSQFLGLVADAPHPAAAKVFLNWSASKAGQTGVSEVTRDYPVRSDVSPPTVGGEKLPARDEIDIFTPEAKEEYYTMRDQWVETWSDIFDYQ